jgi:molybdopterin molybdotransferase
VSVASSLDYDEALERWLAHSPAARTERLSTHSVLGRILAEPIRAPEAIPPFDNSAMDGFALRVPDGQLPAGHSMTPAGAQFAGDGPQQLSGEAIEITTGALVPRGFDAVVPIERVVALRDGRIELADEVRAGQNIRLRGSDIEAGVDLLQPGQLLDAEALTLLAAAGVGDVMVARVPRAAVIATGSELVDSPAQALLPGQIRNCNRPGLVARLRAAGADCVYETTIGDDSDALVAAIEAAEAAGAQMVLSSGAVSMGRHDFVPATLSRLGANVLFHKLRMRPGKPLLAARLPSGVLYAGLPGNPVSTTVGFRFFVEPLLRRLLGMTDETGLRLPLLAPLAARGGFRFHLKARLRVSPVGALAVEVLQGQESFRLAPMLAANCWAVIPADCPDLAAGSLVDVRPLCHLHSFPMIA